jgi:ABC-type multidrug transport system fused ATPase/permease subunit
MSVESGRFTPPSHEEKSRRRAGMTSFVSGLLRPYARLLLVGSHPLPAWIVHLAGPVMSNPKMIVAGASYVDTYYTESVGQWVANDLRLKVYAHLERVSLSYYDQHETGQLLSTLTDDIGTIQSFASASTLGILVDLMTIVGMVGLMFWLNWNFALIATAVTPFLLLFVMRFKAVVKNATREVRKRQSTILAVLQQGLQSIRVVEAFGRAGRAAREISSCAGGLDRRVVAEQGTHHELLALGGLYSTLEQAQGEPAAVTRSIGRSW